MRAPEIVILQDNQVQEWLQALLKVNRLFLATIQNADQFEDYSEYLDQRDTILQAIAACPEEQRQASLYPDIAKIQALDLEIESCLSKQRTQVQEQSRMLYKSHNALRAYQPDDPTDAHYIEEES